jgi:hypothetical protein
MMMRSVFGFMLVCVLLSSARAADEPTEQEQAFIRTLVEALGGESEDVRKAAELALAHLDAKAAFVLVRASPGRAVEMRAGIRSALLAIGPSALAAIEDFHAAEDADHRAFLADIADHLRGGGVLGFGVSPPAVAEKVEELVTALPRDRWSSHDPLIDGFVALGRPAVPALIRLLEPDERHPMLRHTRDQWVVSALERMVVRRDTEALCALLDAGWTPVARLLEVLDDERAVPHIARALERGVTDDYVTHAARHFSSPAFVHPSLELLRMHGTRFPNGLEHLVELLADRQATDAIPALASALDAATKMRGFDSPMALNRERNKVFLAAALVRLGDTRGFPVLIEALTEQPRVEGSVTFHTGWARKAGPVLDRVTGQRFWSHFEDARAHEAYEEWWGEHEGK